MVSSTWFWKPLCTRFWEALCDVSSFSPPPIVLPPPLLSPPPSANQIGEERGLRPLLLTPTGPFEHRRRRRERRRRRWPTCSTKKFFYLLKIKVLPLWAVWLSARFPLQALLWIFLALKKERKVPLAVMSSIRPIVSLAKQQALRRELENCHLVAGIYCTGLSTRQLKELRGSLPETSKLIVAKNSLMENAVEGTKWEPLKFCAKGMNAWLFVHDDDNVPRALKPYRDLQKKWGAGFNDFRGAVFEGKVYGAEDFGELETMPTKMEAFSYLLGCMQAPAATVVGILQEKDRLEAAETQSAMAEGAASA